MSGGDGRDTGNSGRGHGGGKPGAEVKGASKSGGQSGNTGGRRGGANVAPGGSMDIDMGNGMTMHVEGAHAVSPGKGSGAPWGDDSGRGNGGGRSDTQSKDRSKEKAKAEAEAKARAEAQENARRKQAEWEASHPVEVAEQKVKQAEASVNQKQADLNTAKNTQEGLLLASPERHPVSYPTRGILLPREVGTIFCSWGLSKSEPAPSLRSC